MNFLLIDEFPAILNELENLLNRHFANSTIIKHSNFDSCLPLLKSKCEFDFIISEIKFSHIPIYQTIQNLPHNKSKFIVYTGINNPEILSCILKLKIKGLVSKTSNLEELILAIQSCTHKNIFLCNYLQNILSKSNNCTSKPIFRPKEIDILKYAIEGFSVGEIAEMMYLSEDTIRNYRKSMIKRNKSNFNKLIQRFVVWYS
jgi:DNA-binding NarL/FixJ family response regulator